MGVEGHQCECHRARLHADRQHGGAPKRSRARAADSATNPRRPLGHAGRPRRRGDFSGIARQQLRAWARPRCGWRMAWAMTIAAPLSIAKLFLVTWVRVSGLDSPAYL